MQADDPLAYGVERLRHARATTAGDLRGLDARVPVDRAAEHDDDEVGSWPMPKGGDNKPNRRWRVHAPPSTRAGAVGGDVRTSQEVATAKAGVDFAEQRLEQAVGVEG